MEYTMERSLADILREERQLGHKGDGGWNAVAYNTAAAILSAQFDIEVSADNIRNRVKTWKRFYGIVSDILSQSTFSTEGQSCKRGHEGRFAVPLRNSNPPGKPKGKSSSCYCSKAIDANLASAHYFKIFFTIAPSINPVFPPTDRSHVAFLGASNPIFLLQSNSSQLCVNL
ncbi:hypothetical protein PRUPE_5G014400 [Prunus persica]|uniref:Myb/SANT-like domain-containing protein n=1 Tax=Prunus persica TaxID=3760 RepID=A0A251P1U8_PRUPE|nr:hypothetical protein PRUPE_5G014400 [Prunus persica]